MDGDAFMQSFETRRDRIDRQEGRRRYIDQFFPSLSLSSACKLLHLRWKFLTSILRRATMPRPRPKIFAGSTPSILTPWSSAQFEKASCWGPGGDIDIVLAMFESGSNRIDESSLSILLIHYCCDALLM